MKYRMRDVEVRVTKNGYAELVQRGWFWRRKIQISEGQLPLLVRWLSGAEDRMNDPEV